MLLRSSIGLRQQYIRLRRRETVIRHTVWLLDAASAFNELTILDRAGIRDVALWRLGAEDPGLLVDFRHAGPTPRVPPASIHLAEGTNVDIEGPGEILRITALPTPGERKLTFGPTGLLANVDFVTRAAALYDHSHRLAARAWSH